MPPEQEHQERNPAEYEGDLDIDAGLLDALIRIAQIVADRLTTETA